MDKFNKDITASRLWDHNALGFPGVSCNQIPNGLTAIDRGIGKGISLNVLGNYIYLLLLDEHEIS